MKHHYISIIVMLAGILAVLDGSIDPRYHSTANAQGTAMPMTVVSGSGVVEAIHLQRNADNSASGSMFDSQASAIVDPMVAYRIRVRMQDGSTQTVLQDSAAGLHIGERVRLDSGRVYAA